MFGSLAPRILGKVFTQQLVQSLFRVNIDLNLRHFFMFRLQVNISLHSGQITKKKKPFDQTHEH